MKKQGQKKTGRAGIFDGVLDDAVAPAVEACTAQQARTESISLMQAARERSRVLDNGGPVTHELIALRVLLIAALESMTPEQRAEVRRRLGS